MNLQTAHAHARSGRQQFQFFAFRDFAGDQGAGDHGAESAHRERPIDG